MGLRSAAMCCQSFTNTMGYIMRSHGFGLVAYLDDMVTAERWDQAETYFSALEEIITSMGAVGAESKAVSPCTRSISWPSVSTPNSWQWTCHRKECQSAWDCWLNSFTRVWWQERNIWESCLRWERWKFRGSKEKLTVVENNYFILQWGVHDADGKMVFTGWSGDDRCLFEWLWCLVWYLVWVFSCWVP